MGPALKILVGLALMVGSVVAVAQYPQLALVPALITVIKGTVPAFLFLIGLFMVWLELDELRIERELRKEEKKLRKKR